MFSDESEDDFRGPRIWILFRECSERFFVRVADREVEMVFQVFITSPLLQRFFPAASSGSRDPGCIQNNYFSMHIILCFFEKREIISTIAT